MTIASVHRGFSGATVYRLASSAGEFALRNWGPNCLPLPRLRGLQRLLETIRSDGVRTIAVPLLDASGSTVVLHDGAAWQLEPWMSGVANFAANASRNRLRSAMTALAEWHRAARHFEPLSAEREWFRSDPADVSPAARERLQRILKWQRGRLLRLREAFGSDPRDLQNPWDLRRLGRFLIECFESAAPSIAADLQAATEWPVELQPCLRDVWHDHVLFTGDEVTGLIDPSACRSENVAADISRLLGSLVADDRAVWEFAVECYSHHRELRPAELRLLPILDRSSVLLSGLTWLDRYYLQRRDFPDPAAVYRRLAQIASRLANLTGRQYATQSGIESCGGATD